jgi:preprotein translocase subunit SecY
MTSELGRRVWFTIGALLVYRLGSYIPLPGIDLAAWAQIFRSQASGGLLGLGSLFSGGGVGGLAVFSLGLVPYLAAAILLQLLSIVMPGLAALPNRGERGRKRLENYTLGLALIFAAFQGYGIAIGLEGAGNVVTDPGLLFRLTTMLSLTGGAIFLIWLSGQITARGIGNGLALILFAGVVIELPSAVAATLELGRQGVFSSAYILGLLVLAVVLLSLIVFVELGRRRFPVEYARRQVGMRVIEGRSHLSVKINAAGVIPAIVASWLLGQALVIAYFAAGQEAGWWWAVANELLIGRPLHMILSALAIVLCALLYTAFVLNPAGVAADLDKHGGVIPGVAPGEATAQHVDAAISRTAMLGAVYLALVCLFPEMLSAYAQVPFYLGGTSLLIVVCTVLDLDAQLKNGAHIRLGGQRP